jgi:hypothetical protein
MSSEARLKKCLKISRTVSTSLKQNQVCHLSYCDTRVQKNAHQVTLSLAYDVATRLYPHQKKALTFLLDREREKPAYEQFSTLWRSHIDPMSQQTLWTNIVTEEEVQEEPKEAKGAILADDVCHFIFVTHCLPARSQHNPY